MTLRGLLKLALAGGFFLNPILVQASPVYLVELANFACPHCNHMESFDPKIDAEVKATGGAFDFAPVRAKSQTDAAAEVYFAAREQGPQIAAITRALLFEAMYNDGEPLQSVTQGVVFLQQDWPKSEPAPNFQKMATATATTTVQQSVLKAMQLGVSLGVSKLPAFVFIHDGRPGLVLERGTQYPTEPQLASAVLKAIAQQSGHASPSSTSPSSNP
ncbi:hypothetical protein A6M27_17030 [Acidithiobacillus thiooxidans]|uniref:Uncharacterized protein n=2 Tax=Acidithiobacillus thiooxidans TaxID=930 RepID=A0A1C2HY72_ACITH|nr:thioredoxin domain-containing protein [Acidithiobacillus thiooxidans]OCX68698.1 hypothetical protein A6P07_17740 [Acidithiobacillus thiooxidans]OCX81040.1 hypothetical protein A6O26_13690 [Acidithiobacillus thiooxidans]OCX83798.1 hypothetical protein A6M27_17030 [Acidithiobacillus thiooxidans]OFC50284.1 hypothetical protein BAE47_03015 [Acidithiobacillus thiooxidans]